MARLERSSWPSVPWPAWVKRWLMERVHEMTSQPHPNPAYREHPPPGKSRKINSLSRYDVAGQLNSSRALTWPASAMGRRHGPGQQCRSHTGRQACDGLAQAPQKNWGILTVTPVNQSVQRLLQTEPAPTRKLVRHFPIATWASSDTRWNSITMSWAFCCLAIMKIRMSSVGSSPVP